MEEDHAILRGTAVHGAKWKRIAQDLPSRSPSSVRNRYQRLVIWAHEQLQPDQQPRRTRDGSVGVNVAASTLALVNSGMGGLESSTAALELDSSGTLANSNLFDGALPRQGPPAHGMPSHGMPVHGMPTYGMPAQASAGRAAASTAYLQVPAEFALPGPSPLGRGQPAEQAAEQSFATLPNGLAGVVKAKGAAEFGLAAEDFGAAAAAAPEGAPSWWVKERTWKEPAQMAQVTRSHQSSARRGERVACLPRCGPRAGAVRRGRRSAARISRRASSRWRVAPSRRAASSRGRSPDSSLSHLLFSSHPTFSSNMAGPSKTCSRRTRAPTTAWPTRRPAGSRRSALARRAARG